MLKLLHQRGKEFFDPTRSTTVTRKFLRISIYTFSGNFQRSEILNCDAQKFLQLGNCDKFYFAFEFKYRM